MIPKPGDGSFPLFKFRGIQVAMHWTWLLVAVWQIQRVQASREYDGLIWPVLEYAGLFLIVLLHEFGHSFATRQVGGKSDHILLWPFGGIAYVQAPPRPGAHLWSIAAGPLVNVALFPLFYLLQSWAWDAEGISAGLFQLLVMLHYINVILLIFNILPIYPLDGGQMLQALLWFKLGYFRALWIASGIGLLGGGALVLYLLRDFDNLLLPVMLAFLLINSWKSFRISGKVVAEERRLGRRITLAELQPPAPPLGASNPVAGPDADPGGEAAGSGSGPARGPEEGNQR